MENLKLKKINILLKHMNEYQKNNSIEKMCVNNVQILMDNFNSVNPNHPIKSQAVICFYYNKELNTKNIITHLVCSWNGNIIDPSYEVNSIKECLYFKNVKELLEFFPEIKDDKEFYNNSIKHFLTFVDYSIRMNKGEFIITDKEYYNNINDYCEKFL